MSNTSEGARVAGFSTDAKTAMTQAPDYFVWWYTIKSIGLGVAVAALAFVLGRASVRKGRGK